jgi:glutamyl-tRNA synthetase
MSNESVIASVRTWAQAYDPELDAVLAAEPELALRAVGVERDGVENPRKDLRIWSDFRLAYGFFFPQIFEPVADPADQRFGGLAPEIVRGLLQDFAASYRFDDDGGEWFGQIRELGRTHGFATNAKEYKSAPDKFHGSIREVAQTIRVAITGSTRSPDLHAICAAIGTPEVLRRLLSISNDRRDSTS